ncbi:hypothetical protein [Planctobacterium marinum]|uniref:hypothetical protein n=1 Tax=Planctobacterium marinum TaxID=1631968 RepID=UPI001E4F739A|nr:hypothetical protein [Planctobacterium marinum]MCC2604607.1 hypothetical protein [Planctobacterium marinum]
MSVAAKTGLKSQIIWQPLLLFAVVGYLLAEMYFLTVLVNSLYVSEHISDLTQLETTGRVISGAGLGLSVLIGLSLHKGLNRTSAVRRVSIKLGCFILVTIMGYVAMKELYLVMEKNASKNIVHCSLLGNAANRLFSNGNLPDYHRFVGAERLAENSHKQLVRLYLPLHVCLNESYLHTLQTSDVLADELALMLLDTGLPAKVAKPAIAIYQGFKDKIDDFYPIVEGLDNTKSSEPERTLYIDTAVAQFEAFLTTQSRYTRFDIARLSEVYHCSLSALPEATTGPPEQRFLLSVSRCLNTIVKARFPSVAPIVHAEDIYALEGEVARHWSRQLVQSPKDIPQEAFNLMRKSFALVFLPTYAVLVSTFVVFICLAAYVRTRFLIRARRMKQRINPLINASLSPLVVVPFIWTAIFLWLPRTETERVLFPEHLQSQWGKVIEVALRPLFYYYDASLTGFDSLKLPLLVAQVNATETPPVPSKIHHKRRDLGGFYQLSICGETCETVRLVLTDSMTTGRVYYPKQRCNTTLVFAAETDLQGFSYFETGDANSACQINRRWQIQAVGDVLEVVLEEGQQVLRLTAQNLFI